MPGEAVAALIPPPPAAPGRRPAPERREMALVAGLTLFLNLVPGWMLQSLHFRWGLFASQVLFIAGPALLAPRWFYLDRRALLPLRFPGGAPLLAAALGTIGLNHLLTLYGAWQERFAPEPESIRAMFDRLLAFDGPADLALLLIVVAVTPAVCEEILFRGFLQAGLVRAGENAARGIVLSGAVFAAFHLLPWRAPLLFVMGLWLGWLAHRTGSLQAPIVAHALNNVLAVVLPILHPAAEGAIPGSALTVGAAAGLLGVAFWLLARAPGAAGTRVL